VIEQFRNEVRLWLELPVHQHIVHAYEVIVEDSVPYLVMDYVPGGTLADRLKLAGTALPRQDALSFACQICEGMLGASRLGEISHLDLKPSNILIGPNKQAKIADFGLSRFTEMFSAGKTMSGSGTYSYMAPEQYLGEPVSPRCDIFSFGIIFYQMLTGKSPYPVRFTGSRALDMERLEVFHRMLRDEKLPDRQKAEDNGIDYDELAELSEHHYIWNVLASRAFLDLGDIGPIVAGCLGSFQEERQSDFGVLLGRLRAVGAASGTHDAGNPGKSITDWYRKGISYQSLQEHQKALECFNRHLIDNKADAPSYHAAAASLRAIGDDDEAEKLMEIARSLATDKRLSAGVDWWSGFRLWRR
jgi:serine/threonine protein kinase